MSDPVATITMTLSALLQSVGSVMENLLGWLINVANTALQSPIVIVFIALAICGVVVGFAKKLLHF